ncbi:MAG: gas vesicle protein GvpG [Phormidesmis sp. CAN_BIN36]|nr:gas vesicle protein GvpG [Phormidesmis sp. CAN_BIN36]
MPKSWVLHLLLAPVTGLSWITAQIEERADTKLDDTGNLGDRSLALQLAFDVGDIPEEFEIQEEELLLAIQTLEDEALAEAQ